MADEQGPFVNVRRGPEGGPHPCPCCGFLTLERRGYYEICPVCFWDDDGQDDHDAGRVRGGPNRRLSLLDARRNFTTIGASDPGRLKHVRPPRPEEHPIPDHGAS
ncbi:CPCC family cysteine-rich protein [Micromonospora aurantiaca (nom. illeg.)]|uniref:CPCC family cysteine-rich protein n=1 Tax=Micromonospora aurantiaca (nom. illeg.) TaxID=47850 RepID=UPI003EB815FF